MDGLRLSLSAFLPVMLMGLAGSALLRDGGEENTLITTVPYTITEPGTYRLASDLCYGSPSGYAIMVSADGVVIDLSGHKLWSAADPATTSVGIAADQQSHITIQNGTIEGFQFGVRLMGTNRQGHLVRKMVFANNSYIGIWVDGASSVIAGNRVEHTGGCNITRCTTPIGVHVAGPDCTVVDNRVTGFVWCHGITREIVGLALDEAPKVLVAGNVFAQLDYTKNSWGLWANSAADDFSTTVHVEKNYFANFQCGSAFSYSQGHMKDNTYYNVPTKWVVPSSNRETDLGGNSTLPINDFVPDKHFVLTAILNSSWNASQATDAR
jgi:hypothetical protein